MTKQDEFNFMDEIGDEEHFTDNEFESRFPLVTYQASSGTLFVDNEEVKQGDTVEMVILVQKNWVEVDGQAFHYLTANSKLPDGEKERFFRAIVAIDGKLHEVTVNGFVGRMGFLNPLPDNEYNVPNLPAGIISTIKKLVKDAQAAKGSRKSIPLYAFKFKMKAQKKTATVGKGKKTSEVYPLISSKPVYVGSEALAEYRAMYAEEDLDTWRKDYTRFQGNDTAQTTNEPDDEDLDDVFGDDGDDVF